MYLVIQYLKRRVAKIDFARSTTLAVGTYNILIRYRNTKYTSTITGYPLPSSSGNSCFTPVWTIESFSNVVVN